jgi:hypothetical protein
MWFGVCVKWDVSSHVCLCVSEVCGVWYAITSIMGRTTCARCVCVPRMCEFLIIFLLQ